MQLAPIIKFITEVVMKLLCKFLISLFIISSLITCSFNPYEDQQVLSIAPSVKALLLNVKTHIRNTPRPKDPTQFPIALGEVGPTKPLFSGNLNWRNLGYDSRLLSIHS